MWRDFAQLHSSIASISGTDKDIDKRKLVDIRSLPSFPFLLDPSAADWRRRRQPESSGAAAAEKRTARR